MNDELRNKIVRAASSGQSQQHVMESLTDAERNELAKEGFTVLLVKRLAIDLIGTKFIFRAAEFGLKKTPSMEGQELTIVGFNPRRVNNLTLRNLSGQELFMPLDAVTAALGAGENGGCGRVNRRHGGEYGKV